MAKPCTGWLHAAHRREAFLNGVRARIVAAYNAAAYVQAGLWPR
jgi:hypothetical protein